MIQLQTMRLQATNLLSLSARMNTILDHDEAESGSVTADDLGNILTTITITII